MPFSDQSDIREAIEQLALAKYGKLSSANKQNIALGKDLGLNRSTIWAIRNNTRKEDLTNARGATDALDREFAKLGWGASIRTTTVYRGRSYDREITKTGWFDRDVIEEFFNEVRDEEADLQNRRIVDPQNFIDASDVLASIEVRTDGAPADFTTDSDNSWDRDAKDSHLYDKLQMHFAGSRWGVDISEQIFDAFVRGQF